MQKTRNIFLLITFFLILYFPMTCHAQRTFTGKITYLTSTTAYVDLGTNQGFDVGDTLLVKKNAKTIAVLKIATIASKSSSSIILSKDASLREGDEVNGFSMRAVKQPDQTGESVQSIKTDTTKKTATTPANVQASNQKELPAQSNIVRGRVGVQYYAMYNNSNKQLEFSQPAAVLSFSIDKIYSLPLAFSFYSNSRYDARNQELRFGTTYPRLTNRVYEASIKYGAEGRLFGFQLGRFVAPVIGGVGTFDGAMTTIQTGKLQFGFVAGTQPGWRNSDVQIDNPKFAGFINFQSGDFSSTTYQGSVAYAQQYFSDVLDRGFLYIQNNLTLSNSLSIYQNADFDMHDIGSDGPKTALHLSDLFMSASYRPLNWMSVSSSYAIRRNIYFLQSFKNIPDSLFDKSIYQDMQVSIGLRLPFTLFLTTTGMLRMKAGDLRNANSLSMNLSWADIFDSEIGMYLIGSISDNVYNKSNNIGIDIHRDIIRDLYVSLRGQRYSYLYTSPNVRTINRNTIGSDIYYRINRSLYLSISYERYFEESITTDRLYAELSIRF